jgi:hypothetical protein
MLEPNLDNVARHYSGTLKERDVALNAKEGRRNTAANRRAPHSLDHKGQRDEWRLPVEADDPVACPIAVYEDHHLS